MRAILVDTENPIINVLAQKLTDEHDVTCEVLKPQDIVNLKEDDVVVHSSIFMDISEAEALRDDYDTMLFKTNVELTRQLSALVLSKNATIVYLSQDVVFDCVQEDEYSLDNQPEPASWLGITTYMGEREVVASGAKYKIVRLAHPFGFGTVEQPDWIGRIKNDIVSGVEPDVFEDELVNPISIDQVVDGLVTIFRDSHSAGLYHLSGSTTVSTHEIAMFINDQYDQLVQIEPRFLIDDERSDNVKTLNTTIVNTVPSLSEDNLFDLIYSYLVIN